MGRKPKASKTVEKLMAESANPTSEGGKSQLEMQTNPALVGGKSQLEMQTNPALVGETPQFEMQANPSSLSSSRKRVKDQAVVVRRSWRLRSAFRPAQRNDGEPEEIYISESEKEDEPQVYEQDKFLEPTQGNGSLEEKLDSVLEAQKVILEALKSKEPKISPTSQGPCRTDAQYRSLYIESQKKIETLTDENLQLCKKLENALGKVEVYEKGPHLLTEMLEKLKDVILISNITKATEAAINLSSQAIHGGVPSPNVVTGAKTLPAKRKKHAKNGEN